MNSTLIKTGTTERCKAGRVYRVEPGAGSRVVRLQGVFDAELLRLLGGGIEMSFRLDQTIEVFANEAMTTVRAFDPSGLPDGYACLTTSGPPDTIHDR